ncbi:MAG: NAD-dependent DNA ligase LigA [Deltaproteobacteria bacterium]|jgi:DNA ligase (NAD+)|nr:NAD-dependent DNA ligase LigA [Deltaproteobacteria bacterium]
MDDPNAPKPNQLKALKDRADFLAGEIPRHNKLYFQDQAPEIEDSEFDALQREYDLILEAHPDWRPKKESPDQTIGAPPSGGLAKYTREEPMLSLEKALKEEEILDFDAKLAKALGQNVPRRYFAMPKFDGLAIELYYEGRNLELAVTRGDGLTGEIVTEAALTVKNIPARLPAGSPAGRLVARGEIYMEKAEFKRLNAEREEEGLTLFANPRNAAAGALKRLDPKAAEPINLNFFAYGLVRPESFKLNSYAELMASLKDWGFPVEASSYTGLKDSLDEIIKIFQALSMAREDLPYEVDGLVITLDDLTLWPVLGLTARAPRWSVAAKFPPRLGKGRILGIVVQVGRLGTLTPVANLTPTHIGGAVITQVSLHNEDFLLNKDIRVGDWAIVKRAGDVIPEIISVIPEERGPGLEPFKFPENCPACGQPAIRLPGKATRACVNFFCQAKIKARLTYFASKNALDIEGLGPEVADLLLSQNLIQNPSDLFRLSGRILAVLPGLGPKSAKNLIAAIDRARTAELWRFINSLSIPAVGDVVSRTLTERFKTLAELVAALKAVKEPFQKSCELEREYPKLGFTWKGPESKILRHIREYFKDPRNQASIAKGLNLKVEEGQTVKLARFIKSLSIQLVGTLTSESLAETFKTFAALTKAVKAADELCSALTAQKQEIKKIGFADLGNLTIEKMLDFFEDPNNHGFLADLLNPDLVQPTPPKTAAGPLAGLRFCLTGVLSQPRAEVENKLKALGAQVDSAVGASLNFLVAGAKTGQTKLGAAQKKGVKIVDEDQFNRLLEKNFLKDLESLASLEEKLAKIDDLLATFSPQSLF